jgi:predicted alpha/beta hydrolase
VAKAGQDDVFVDDITFPAVDGYLLAATLLLPRGRKRSAVLINAATGVSRHLYRGFASYLAGRGCAVLTYDYRGISGSRLPSMTGLNKPRSLKNFDASLSGWAARDVTAAVAWMRGRYKDLPLTYVGHGFGGQALGLLPNNAEVSRALLIAAQTVHWKMLAKPEGYRVFAKMRVAGLPATKLLGYAPAILGLGEDLPKGVFEEWTRWTMSPRSLFDDKTLASLGNFSNYTGALRAMCFSDDASAPREAMDLLCSGFTATKPEIVSISPSDVGATKIGHRGFFEPQHRDTLWRGAAEWLEKNAVVEPRRYSAAARA